MVAGSKHRDVGLLECQPYGTCHRGAISSGPMSSRCGRGERGISAVRRSRSGRDGTGPMSHDLDIAALAVVSACVLVWGLVSARLERWDVSAPIAFVVLGRGGDPRPDGAGPHQPRTPSTIRSLAEVTLALVLFADASRVNVRATAGRRRASRPASSASGSPSPSAPAPPRPRSSSGAAGSGWLPPSAPSSPRPTPPWAPRSCRTSGCPSGVRRLTQRGERAQRRHRDAIRQPLHRRGGDDRSRPRRVQPSPPPCVELLGGAALGLGVGVVGARPPRRRPGATAGARRRSVRWPSLALALFAYSASRRRRHQRLHRRLRRRHGLRHRATTTTTKPPWTSPRRSGTLALPSRLVRVRRRHAGAGPRGRGLARRRCSRSSPSPCADGAGGARPRRLGPRPGHGRLRRVVRAARPGLGGLRPHRGRLARAGGVTGGARRGHRHRRAERPAPRRHRLASRRRATARTPPASAPRAPCSATSRPSRPGRCGPVAHRSGGGDAVRHGNGEPPWPRSERVQGIR